MGGLVNVENKEARVKKDASAIFVATDVVLFGTTMRPAFS
jgi:hypothetical protein